jgi:nucleoid DNA-binding protein
MAKSTKNTSAAKAPTKSEVYSAIAEKTQLTRKQVASVFDELSALIKKNLNRGPQAFTVPGLCKMVVKKKPATKARKGINPFTGQEAMFKAKPARTVIKIRPLKKMKDMV